MRTHGRKALGLVLMAALGLMAFSATAQAAELVLIRRHLALLLNSGTVLGTGTTTTASGKQIGTAILKIPGKNAEIRCETGTVSEASAENVTDTQEGPEITKLTEKSASGLSATGKGKIQFSKCKVFTESTGVELAACTKAFNENNEEKIGSEAAPSAKVLLLFLLHFHKSTIAPVLESLRWLVRLSPHAGFPFTKLKFGGTCSLPEKVEVTGNATTLVPTTDATKQKVKFDTGTAEGQTWNSEAEAKLKFGANEAFIKGEVEVELLAIGGATWGVM